MLLRENKILLPLYSNGFNFSLVAISNDDGVNWYPSLSIVGRGNVLFSYLSMLRASDGMLHITYSYQVKDHFESIKYVVINPELMPKA